MHRQFLGRDLHPLVKCTFTAHRKYKMRFLADRWVTIYAQAFGRDAEFYQFLRTLEAYKTTVDPSTTLFLGTDTDFYKHLRSAGKR